MEELYTLPIRQQLKLLYQDEISPTSLVRAYIRHLKLSNRKINAVNELKEEYANNLAEYYENHSQGKKSDFQLFSLPFSIKNTMFVCDFSPTMGSTIFGKQVANEDATIIKRLKNSGAIPIGTTNVPELLIGLETDNCIYGLTKNPYNYSRTVGGSSGGEAALVSIGGSAFGVASDGGGSIRLPAHYCGVVGYRPTMGAIPLTGLFPILNRGFLFAYITFGFITRYVDDIALLLPIASGPDGQDILSECYATNNSLAFSAKNIKVGFACDTNHADTHRELQKVIINISNELIQLKFQISEFDVSLIDEAYELFIQLVFSDKHAEVIESILLDKIKPNKLLSQVIACMKESHLNVALANNILCRMESLRVKMMRFFDEIDILILPTAPYLSPMIGEKSSDPTSIVFLALASIIGCPSISVPCGLSDDNVPLSCQVVSKPGQDILCLEAAKFIEEMLGGWVNPNRSSNNNL